MPPQGRVNEISDYLLTAFRANRDELAGIMINSICADCPEVLWGSHWHRNMEPLVTSFPGLFHRLLRNLQVR